MLTHDMTIVQRQEYMTHHDYVEPYGSIGPTFTWIVFGLLLCWFLLVQCRCKK